VLVVLSAWESRRFGLSGRLSGRSLVYKFLKKDWSHFDQHISVEVEETGKVKDVPRYGSPYKTVQVNNFNKLYIISCGST
jgi:hypothetical protein